MKKGFKILLTTFIIVCSVFIANLCPINNKQIQESLNLNISNSNEENKIEKIDYTNVLDVTESRYNLGDEIYIKVENQQKYGICYAFAGLTMLETYLAKQYNEYYDFSEIHLATSKYVDRGNGNTNFVNDGGNIMDIYTYFIESAGPVLEEEMPFSTFYSYSQADMMESNASSYYSNNFENFSDLVDVNEIVSFHQKSSLSSQTDILANRNAIKNHIKTYGSLIADIFAGSGSSTYWGTYNSTSYLKSAASDQTSNHMISIVGWDDNYKAPDWNEAGAYICVNSWGASWGAENGYFYVSYNDSNIEEFVYGITDATLNQETYISNIADKKGIEVSSFNLPTSTFSQIIFGTVIDVSNYKNTYINSISTSLVANAKFSYYLYFTNTLPTTSTINNFAPTLVGTTTNNSSMHSATVSGATIYSHLGTLATTISLDSPTLVNGNYAFLVVKIENITEHIHFNGLSVSGSSNEDNILYNSYFKLSPDNSYSSFGDLGYKILLINKFGISANAETSSNYISNLKSKIEIEDNGFIKNNISFLNNTLYFTVSSKTDDFSVDDITIYSPSSTLTTLSKTNHTSAFIISIDKLSTYWQVNLKQTSSLNSGIYILELSIGDNKVYKSFSVSDEISCLDINYQLNGGTNSNYNPKNYLPSSPTINLYDPTKLGYDFAGWFTDAGFSNKITGTSGSNKYGNYTSYTITEFVSFSLYAKWELVDITIVSQSSNVSQKYNGNSISINVNASHPLENSSTPINYQWFYSENNSSFSSIPNANSSTYQLKNVSQSGYYKCTLTFTLDETTTVSTETIQVVISKGDYQISWNYSSPFSYDGTQKSIGLSGLNKYGSDLIADISNNAATNAGEYQATVSFTNNNENYNAPTLGPITWEISPAELTININDVRVSNQNEFDSYTNFSHSVQGTIYDNYDLNISYILEDTSNANIKNITATYSTNTNYIITINKGTLALIKTSLSTNIDDVEISVENELGFVVNSEFTATEIDQKELSSKNQTYFEKKDMTIYHIYELNLTENINSNNNIITISVDKSFEDKNMKLFRVTDTGVKEVDCTIKNGVLTFTSDELGQFIIVESPEETDASIIISLVIVIIGALVCCFVINGIRHHRKNKYKALKNDDFIPH